MKIIVTEHESDEQVKANLAAIREFMADDYVMTEAEAKAFQERQASHRTIEPRLCPSRPSYMPDC